MKERPLLVIDGDSFAHRSYHALPKTIVRNGGKGAGAIVGFANFLLRFTRPGTHRGSPLLARGHPKTILRSPSP